MLFTRLNPELTYFFFSFEQTDIRFRKKFSLYAAEQKGAKKSFRKIFFQELRITKFLQITGSKNQDASITQIHSNIANKKLKIINKSKRS